MDIEFTPDAARWVEAEVASGTFASPEAVVRQAVDQVRLTALKVKLELAIEQGGRNTSEDALRFVRDHLDVGIRHRMTADAPSHLCRQRASRLGGIAEDIEAATGDADAAFRRRSPHP